MNKSKIGHNELAHLLAEHLSQNSDKMIWEDLIMGSSGNCRPDVYTMMKSYSNPRPTAYEIKISVGDFRSDVTTGKWMKYLKYAQGVYFCVPLGLVTKNDIPDGAGLITYNTETGSFRTVKKATLANVTPPFDVMQKLLINGIERHRAQIRPKIFSEWVANDKISKKFGEETAKLLSDRTALRNEITRLEAIKKAQIDNIEEIKSKAQKQAFEARDDLMELVNQLAELLGVELASGDNIHRRLNRIRFHIGALARQQTLTGAHRVFSVSVDSIISELEKLQDPVKFSLLFKDAVESDKSGE